MSIVARQWAQISEEEKLAWKQRATESALAVGVPAGVAAGMTHFQADGEQTEDESSLAKKQKRVATEEAIV